MQKNSGFTLIELLVVVAIIAILISILLPSLSKARDQARAATCGANLRAVGTGINIYQTDYDGIFPTAYYYAGQFVNGKLDAVTTPANGYVNWSYFIYKGDSAASTGGAAASGGLGSVPAKAFICPSSSNSRGGLPPTNPSADNFDPGQVADVPGIVDFQVPRLSYTVNAALCPRNKFGPAFGTQRMDHWVKSTSVQTASVILGTEWNGNSQIIAGAPEVASSGGLGNVGVCKSHRPVSGFTGSGDPETWVSQSGIFGGTSGSVYDHIVASQLLTTDPQPGQALLDLDKIGRNHGSGNYVNKRANFVYIDGHVENKTVQQTCQPGASEWGQVFYSLSPSSGLGS